MRHNLDLRQISTHNNIHLIQDLPDDSGLVVDDRFVMFLDFHKAPDTTEY